MKYIKMFIAGMALPSLVLPFLLFIALLLGRSQLLTLPFFHFIPLIWGVWNIFYFVFLKKNLPGNQNIRLLLTGALLGLVIALYGVFWLNISYLVGLDASFTYLPLLLAPMVYALLWRFVVKPLNHLFGLQDH